ncbi:MAG: PilZ domain-containing protein [Nitrospirota bacterium]|nr:PilZ domain-containing protein [Nitrospirota bacterium]
MENAFPSVIETDGYAPQKNPRRHARRPICLRVAVADKSGMAEGQSLNLSLRGGGLRVGKCLVRGQNLWLKIYHAQGRSTAICDLVRVKWVEQGQVGVEFLYIAPENLQRLHKLLGYHRTFTLED